MDTLGSRCHTPDQLNKKQQKHRSGNSSGNCADDVVGDRYSQCGKQPSGEVGANDSDDNVANQTEATTLYDEPGQPPYDPPRTLPR